MNWFDKELDVLDNELAEGTLTEKEYNIAARSLRDELHEYKMERFSRMMQDYDDRY